MEKKKTELAQALALIEGLNIRLLVSQRCVLKNNLNARERSLISPKNGLEENVTDFLAKHGRDYPNERSRKNR